MPEFEKSEYVAEDKSEIKTPRVQGRYIDSQSSVDENKSSGWVLLIVGSVGIIAVILSMVGVIPIKFNNPYLFYGVLCAIFVLFLVMGFVSFANAKKFESKAKGEKTLRDSLIEWAEKNLTAEDIDKEIDIWNTESDEILYFKRSKVITDKLNKQFVNLDPMLVDNLIDNVIYEKIYPLPEVEDEYEEDSDADDDFDDDFDEESEVGEE